jgi:hypothetical protein
MNQTTKKADTASKVSKIDSNYKAPIGRSTSSNATVELLRTPVATDNSALDAIGLETEQTPARIWSFYRKRLIKEGFINIS